MSRPVSSLSGETVRRGYWKKAGELLNALRARHGWSAEELAARAGVTAELVYSYEQARTRFPELEAMWRLATALETDLLTFLQMVTREGGLNLLHDVRLPQQASLTTAKAGASTAREQSARPMSGAGQDQLSSFVSRLDRKR